MEKDLFMMGIVFWDFQRVNADETLANNLGWRHQDEGWHLHVVFWVSSMVCIRTPLRSKDQPNCPTWTECAKLRLSSSRGLCIFGSLLLLLQLTLNYIDSHLFFLLGEMSFSKIILRKRNTSSREPPHKRRFIHRVSSNKCKMYCTVSD